MAVVRGTEREHHRAPAGQFLERPPRSTLFRSGVYVFGGQVPPGYAGELNMGIYNFSQEEFRLEMGARVVHIMFFEVKGEGNLYRGQWQGGRVTTDQRETQV